MNESQSEKLKAVEETAYLQLRNLQEKTSEAIEEERLADIRTLVSCTKDMLTNYRDAARERRVAEVSEGQMLPITVLHRYKSAFYPRLQAGVEDMRMTIESLLPVSMRAEFKLAWNKAYSRYVDAAREAEESINDYETLAKEEALSLHFARENNKALSTKAVSEQLNEEKRKKRAEDEARSRARKKASKNR